MQKIGVILGIVVMCMGLPTARAAAKAKLPMATIYTALSSSTPIEASTPIEHTISTWSAPAGTFLLPVLNAVDTGRASVDAFLASQSLNIAPHLPGNSLLDPTETKKVDTAHLDWHGALISIVGVLWTVLFYIVTIIRYGVDKIVLFYPLMAVAIGYVLFKLFQRISNKRRRGRRKGY